MRGFVLPPSVSSTGKAAEEEEEVGSVLSPCLNCIKLAKHNVLNNLTRKCRLKWILHRALILSSARSMEEKASLFLMPLHQNGLLITAPAFSNDYFRHYYVFFLFFVFFLMVCIVLFYNAYFHPQ